MQLKSIYSLALVLATIPAAVLAQSVPLTQDSYVVPGNASNFGGSAAMNVGGAGLNQALAQFDLSALPSGTVSSNVSVNGTNNPVAAAAVASGVSVSTAGTFISTPPRQ